ncbi:putative aminoglycoside phosphotransferase [Halanaeroarchaeum sp. HSR-CO]|uniref:phosphotransferase family protein n=1 Tax=Halanaeroarchaeum sp. HSR-CO TaxID=2866382 RepID=UPI00217F1667|nr:phosphotransferase family protein [Halanaeroarchaeum sp. HSR-CO]UWG46754.1 putative aminoglycoside phosphotransferase [Halanaeroarchaeum sp. HSR-CO]
MTEDREEYFERLVDEQSLSSYLTAELGPAATFGVDRHDEGHSNETLFVTWGERDLVVRRPPPGETADTAHQVLREYRVMDALQETPVPVPPTVLACEDESIIGSEFYVMERVDGDVLRDDEPERFATPSLREQVGETLVDTLASIHAVDYDAVGLADFGRPEGYTARQVERWQRQLAWAFERTEAVRAIPELEEVGAWLAENAPTDHPRSLVHGDYKLDNVLYAPGTPPSVAAIFDWEMATLGDPRADLGWLLAYWRDDTEPAVRDAVHAPAFTAAEGYPSRRDLVERWEARTGFTFEHERFYRVLAVYKLAGLGEMFYRRHLEGNADDALYPEMETRVPALAERALAIRDGKDPL